MAVEGVGGEALEDEGWGAGGFEAVAFGREEELESFEDVGLVVGDEEAGWRHGVCCSGGTRARKEAGSLRE